MDPKQLNFYRSLLAEVARRIENPYKANAVYLRKLADEVLPALCGTPPIYQVWSDEAREYVTVTQERYASCLPSARRIVYGERVAPAAIKPFQQRVQPWLMECFGPMIAGDREERNHRLLEEALELVQACGCTASEAHQLVDYVFGRPVGDPHQEVGGVMVTLAALCLANGLDMHVAGETELARISVPQTVAKIRAKQAAKPKHSPLPEAVPTTIAADAGAPCTECGGSASIKCCSQHCPQVARPDDCTALSEAHRAVILEASRSLAERADELKASNTSMDGTWCDAAEQAQYEAEVRLIERLQEVYNATPTERMSDAARDVLAERARQISVEGWTPEHDDGANDVAAMADAAACYAMHAAQMLAGAYCAPMTIPHTTWPWDASWWKPTSPRRDLVKAGALILAEIERIDRAARKAESERGKGDTQ